MDELEIRDQVDIDNLFKEQISLDAIEKKMLEQPQADVPLSHFFAGGVYLRQVELQKGTLAIGKRHRYKSCNILLYGDMTIYSGDGVETGRITGPYIFETEPNVRKLVFCHTDCAFINVWPTTKTNVDSIEEEFIVSENEYVEKLEVLKKERDDIKSQIECSI